MGDSLRAVFIDFDGTLVDSLPALYGVYERVLLENECQPTREEFHSLLGPSLPEVMMELIKRHRLQISPKELLVRYRDLVHEVYQTQVRLKPGADAFIEQVVNCGHSVWIVSSAPAQLIQAFLTEHPIRERIDGVIDPEGLKESKPNPAIYKKALNFVGVSPREVVAVEDTDAGVASATGAGIRTLLLAQEAPAPTPLLAGVFSDWREISSWVKERA